MKVNNVDWDGFIEADIIPILPEPVDNKQELFVEMVTKDLLAEQGKIIDEKEQYIKQLEQIITDAATIINSIQRLKVILTLPKK